jgi:redox-sensitive bicupin YhaK (pirin superfamily)
MSIKKIEVIVPPREPHFVGDGFRVHNFIPSAYRLDMHRMDPFIMLDYNSRFYFPPSDKPKGVGVHPHRGFETVTIAYKGRVAHHDSAGGGGIISEGDVQWMTAASGVLHKEYHEEIFSKEGGEFQMVQLWVNLPAKYKMSNPKYQAIANREMGIVKLENNSGLVEIISGEYQGIKGPANTFTPITMLNVKLNSHGEAEFNFPAHFNTALLVIDGEIQVNETAVVPADHFLLFENEGEQFTIKGLKDSTVLVLSGEPINEPITAHGPFVMNTRQELVQAFQDFQNGMFGFLED